MSDIADLRPEELEEIEAFEAKGFVPEFRAFGFTAYFDEAVKNKFYLFDFEVINHNLNIADYGDGIHRIIFSFTALAPNIPPENEYVVFKKEEKVATLNLQLNYEEFLAADNEEAVEMLKALYLKGIQILSFFNVEDFDFGRFLSKVKESLSTQNL